MVGTFTALLMSAGLLFTLTRACLSLNQTGYAIGSMGTPNPHPVSYWPYSPGNQYWVRLPDQRVIVVNYRGEVFDSAHLPPQEGITNNMYYSILEQVYWVWTVPAGASNIPAWIDP